MPKRVAKPDADPDKLVRQSGGAYRTADERFDVEQSNGMWFLADQRNADDLGLPRVSGPYPTLRDVREAIPKARDAPASIRPPTPRTARASKPAPPEKPETWLDRLAPGDRRRATRTMEALESLGFRDAEDLARAAVEGRVARGVARRLLDARVAAALEDADTNAAALVARVLETVIAEGGPLTPDLPGWALVETDPDGTPTDRRIDLG
jgi:hypothetical protein